MALVAAVVSGRPLMMRGCRYSVGEAIMLDTENAQHREVLDSRWALPAPTAPPAETPAAAPSPDEVAPAAAKAVDAPERNKMVSEAPNKSQVGADRRTPHRKG